MTLSLYIHIPFCKRKCNYCDFYSVGYSDDLVTAFINSLVIEYELLIKKWGLGDCTIDTLYFGGGTPSILSTKQFHYLNDHLLSKLPLTKNAEISFECNPDSNTEEKADVWRAAGINRLTIGIQSLHDNELTLLGRPHTAQQVIDLLKNPALEKFASLGVDVMYGIPKQTVKSLESTLASLLSHQHITHLSAYELTIAEGTPFAENKMLELPDDDSVLTMTHCINNLTHQSGFVHYEVSNYARPGFECRHNKIYWTHKPYLGLGPGAHSYIHPQRFSNIKNIHTYCEQLSHGILPNDFSETITNEMLAREMIFLGLRTIEGIDENLFQEKTGEVFYSESRKKAIDGYYSKGHLLNEKDHWRLTSDGMLLADAIIADLF